MKTILHYLTLLMLFCLSPALAKPEWLHVGLRTKTITSNKYEHYNYSTAKTKTASTITANITFTFKNNSRYQAILAVKKPTFYVSGYIEVKGLYHPQWQHREYFKNVRITASETKTVEIFPGESINLTYGKWNFAQISGKNKSLGSTTHARIVLTGVSARCELTTRELSGSGLKPRPKPTDQPPSTPTSSNGIFKASSAKMPLWVSCKRTNYRFIFSTKPLTMKFVTTYTITNKSSIYAITSVTNRRVQLSGMRYLLGNKSYNCGKTSAALTFKNTHIEVMPGKSATFSLTSNLIPYAKTPAHLFNRKVREGAKSAVRITANDKLSFDFTYTKR